MRASLYEGSRTFRTAPATRPARAQDQALLRVLRAGICGTDLHILEGHLDHRIPKGGIIGHETFADVVPSSVDAPFASTCFAEVAAKAAPAGTPPANCVIRR